MSLLISDPVEALLACVNALKARGYDSQKPGSLERHFPLTML